MSGSPDASSDEHDEQRILRLLNDLADLVETDPRTVARQTNELLPMLREHYVDPAYGWALSLRAQACRFLDDLAGVLEATTLGLATFGDDRVFAAQLHLEAGMALNQFGAQTEALDHLQRSASTFRQLREGTGEAWALVAIAEALAGLGYPEDPFAYLDSAVEGRATWRRPLAATRPQTASSCITARWARPRGARGDLSGA